MSQEIPQNENSQDLDFSTLRLISQVLAMYYFEENTQSVIAKKLGISAAKVSRLIKYARENNMVEITINTPFQQAFEIEKKLEMISGIKKTIVVPSLSDSDETVMRSVGKATADYLLSQVKNGDTIGVGGGHTLNVMFKEISAGKNYDVTVVPCIGGVQGLLENSTNFLTNDLAKRLGGKFKQLHAPAFVESKEARDALMQMGHVKEIFDIARAANIVLVVVGAIDPDKSSFFKFTQLPAAELQNVIKERNAAGEITSHVFDTNGKLCAPEYSERVVGLTLDEVCAIPQTIGVAGLRSKVKPVAAALKGGLLDALIIDESTALSVIALLEAGW